MNPKVLKTEKQYREAIALVERLWDAPKGTPQADELELWSLLVESYEREHHPIGSSNARHRGKMPLLH